MRALWIQGQWELNPGGPSLLMARWGSKIASICSGGRGHLESVTQGSVGTFSLDVEESLPSGKLAELGRACQKLPEALRNEVT